MSEKIINVWTIYEEDQSIEEQIELISKDISARNPEIDFIDYVIMENSKASFDDIKHVLYSGVKYICFNFDINEYEDYKKGNITENESLYKLYDYSKERFPDKIFISEYDVNKYIRENIDDESPRFEFSDFKTNSDGLIPVIAQDYKTNEVLMMAYMNEESYKKTLDTGLMTYWSRSRQKLWTKGEESGHIQKMVSLTIDCDKDTILAKVDQTGPACHTGNPTCFFTPLTDTTKEASSFKVFQDVYDVIADRKVNPREGSYTNYLFDKGIDKILKKVGEECTEIVIAAKNPDAAEIKYEIADFLYHAMVMMVEKGVTWDEIIDELVRRE